MKLALGRKHNIIGLGDTNESYGMTYRLWVETIELMYDALQEMLPLAPILNELRPWWSNREN